MNKFADISGMKRRRYGQHKVKQRQDRRLKVYNLDPDIYNTLLRFQDSRCAICGEFETAKVNGYIKTLSVDHDHKCCDGKESCGECVRGLLCNSCNLFIAKIETKGFDIIDLAIKYITLNGSMGELYDYSL